MLELESYRTDVSGRLPVECPLGSSGLSLSPSNIQVLSLPHGRLAHEYTNSLRDSMILITHGLQSSTL